VKNPRPEPVGNLADHNPETSRAGGLTGAGHEVFKPEVSGALAYFESSQRHAADKPRGRSEFRADVQRYRLRFRKSA